MKKEISCGSILYRYKKGIRQFLLIHQRRGDFIGFPKGHMEENESYVKTALRETKEETNVSAWIYEDMHTTMTYVINDQINKTVILFLATALNDDIIKQDEEVKNLLWIDERNVLSHLTHDLTKQAFLDVIKQFKYHIEYQMDIELVSYLYEKILPIYHQFDQAHQLDHIHQVLKTSLDIAKDIKEIDLRLVYIIAFYHDIGNLYGRDDHHLTGAKYLYHDQMLKKYFSEEEMLLMKEAIEDHRASNHHEPRSIYGKIIAEADREIIPNLIIKRTVLFGLSHYPDLTIEEHSDRAILHLNEKYGEDGYLKLWLYSKKNVEGLKELRSLIKNKDKLRKIVEKYYKEYKKM